MKAKEFRNILLSESADDKIEKKTFLFKRKDKKPQEIQHEPFLQYHHKVVPKSAPMSLQLSSFDVQRETENQYEIVRLTKNDRVRKNLLLLGEDVLKIAADPNTSHILNMTGKMYTEMLRRQVPFRKLLKNREFRRIAADVGLHPISLGWALFKGVGDVAVGNVMKNKKLSYKKEHIKKSFEEGIANKEGLILEVKRRIQDAEYLIAANDEEMAGLNLGVSEEKIRFQLLASESEKFKDYSNNAERAIKKLQNFSKEDEEKARSVMRDKIRDVDNEALKRIYLKQVPDIANSALHSITQMKARQDVDAYGKDANKYLSRTFSRKWWQDEIGDDRLKIEKRVRKTFENDMVSFLFSDEEQ